MNGENFIDFYNQAVDIGNCVFGDLETKNKAKNSILFMCVLFANQYEENMAFRKEADEYINFVRRTE